MFTLFGMSHCDAPVDVRERLTLSSDAVAPLVQLLSDELGPCVVLSTCSRFEVYLAEEVDEAVLVPLLSDLAGFDPSLCRQYFSLSTGDAAVRHLFSVAAGIESMIIGEPDILGQVRTAYGVALEAGTNSPGLDRLFHAALRAGRRARSGSGIGEHALSVSSIAAAQALTVGGAGERSRVLVIGAGDAGRCAAEALIDRGVSNVVVANRTFERALSVARSLGARAAPFDRLGDELLEADVVISASGSPQAVVRYEELAEVMHARGNRPLFIVDIAVPRDFDPKVAELPGVSYCDLDDLQATSAENSRAREAAVPCAREIVEAEARRFAGWVELQGVVPTIAALTEQAEQVRREQLQKTLRSLAPDAGLEGRLEALTRALVKQLLHAPIMTLRESDTPAEAARAARSLFHLNEGMQTAEGD